MINFNDRNGDFSSKVHKLALELKNPRLEGEALDKVMELPSLKLKMDRKRRMLTGGPLTFLEAKILVREQLTFDKWKIHFYEVPQFPQARYFESHKEAKNYWKKIKMRKTVFAEEAFLSKPAEHIFAERAVDEVFRVEGFKKPVAI